jgi:hypothetical protein
MVRRLIAPTDEVGISRDRAGKWSGSMRTAMGVVGLIGFLGWTGSAAAQTSAATILGGVSPANIVSKPIDTSHAIAPNPGMSATQQNRFNFSAIIKRLTPGFPSQRGLSALPIPSSFPSTSYNPFKMVGSPPRLIGDPKNTAMPMSVPIPFTPTVKSPVGPGSGG